MKQIEIWLQQGLAYFSQNPILLILLIVIGTLVLFGLGWILARRKSHVLALRINSLESDLRNAAVAADTSQQKAAENETALQELTADYAGLKATLTEKEKYFSEQKQTLEDAEKRLTTNFENLANKIFTDKQKQFSEQSNQTMDALLNPFKLQLADFRKRVAVMQIDNGFQEAMPPAHQGPQI